MIQTALVTGEVSPALFGHVDLVRMHSAASTMRNFWVSYRGGAYSRAGTEFVGFSKQTGRSYPPRMIPFQFSINQGLALEFGNYYMRVIFDGGYVTEAPYVISAATKASPCVLTVAATSSLDSVVPINSAVSASYVPGDTVSLAGGTFTTRSVVTVGQTLLASVAINNRGTNYQPNDLITLSGGNAVVPAVVQIATVRIKAASIITGGGGGTPGVQTLTGTTGTGTKFQASVTISGGGIVTAINSITVQGSYTAIPNYPVTGAFTDLMTGAGTTAVIFSVSTEISTMSIVNPGQYVANASGGTFTQASTTSVYGTGATFQTGLFGIYNATVTTAGSYSVLPSNPVAQFGTSGTGAGVTFTASWLSSPTLSTGDWIFVDDVVGMTQLNGRTFVVSVSGASVSLFDVYGNNIDSTGYSTYTSGGTASRIYTLTTQFSEVDLKWIKYTQSADTMSLCCINQDTGTEYPAVDLARSSDTSWAFTPAVPVPSVSPPTGVALTASTQPSSPTTDAGYAYVITAVAEDGTESIASNIATLSGVINIGATAGSILATWTGVAGINQYNIYKATPTVNAHTVGTGTPPAGALFGYAGSAYGNSFIDGNIVPDFSQVPPLHRNPFSRGQILAVLAVAGGSGYVSDPTVTINTFTGGGAVIQPVRNVSSNTVVGFIILDPGTNYAPTDTVTISGGSGSGATATLTIGPQIGTYPGVVAYFQQRRFYAYTLNQPDTYFASQPGAFNNFDRRIPTIDSDAFDGTPWSTQVNGIQFMVPAAGGLVVLTGLEAYFLTGQGGSAFSPQPVTPSSQSAVPQGFNGCAPFMPPIRIYQDVLYVQSKGAKYRAATFDMNRNTYTGADITQNSAHLFDGYTMVSHAWCEEPYRLLWPIRNDGIMLSLTWDKDEKVVGWARHDTFGRFESNCSVTEPPVDALYCATQRFIGDETAYVVERMNNRLWQTVEDVWCVDCGLSYAQATPDATLSASSAGGLGSLTGVTNLVSGSGYSSSTTATVVDDNGQGPGSGAVAILTIVAGAITAVSFSPAGTGYVSPKLVIKDPSGSDGGTGASADITLDDDVTFTASASVFAVGDVGSVIRMGGGVATITSRTSGTIVHGQLTSPIRTVIPNSGGLVLPAASGDWTMTAPTSVVSGLWPLVGATVTGVADGIEITPQVVAANGTITLDAGTFPDGASQITVGLAYLPQLQSVYLEAGEPTIQGQRKKVAEVTARVQASGAFTIGSNQPDGSVQSPIQIAPEWQDMADAPNPAINPYNSRTQPLFTGDIRIPVGGGFQKPGQVAVEQPHPFPLQILAFIPEVWTGDTPSQKAPEKQGKQK